MSPARSRPPGPFPGLRPFSETDADWFCGRTSEIELVVDDVLSRPLTVLFGASGAGKSSLLHAGVMPQLEALSWPRVTAVVCSSWGDGASTALRHGLAGVLGQADTTVGTQEESLDALVDAAARASGGRLVIVLDQFEDQFADGRPADEAFARALAGAGPAVNVLIAVREDMLGELDRFTGLLPGLYDNLIHLDQLDEGAAHAAIGDSIAAWNAANGESVTVEAGLVEAVLEQIGDGDGDARRVPAPHLQLVMARLWQRDIVEADGDSLRLATLTDLGDADEIADKHVEEALAALAARDREVAARMLRHLVTPSGAKVVLSIADLAGYADVPELDARRLLERLASGDTRLLTPAVGAHYSLSHDVLVKPVLEWCERWSVAQASRRERRRLLAIMCFVAALLGLLTLVDALEPLELATVDARFVMRGTQAPPRDLVLVKIDDASLAKLRTTWPLRRSTEGDAIDWIGDGDPKVIAYDVDFSGSRPDDRSLEAAIYGSPHRVVLAASAVSPDGRVDLFGSDTAPRQLEARAGYAGVPPDLGGVIRRPFHSYNGMASFAVAAAETVSGRPISRDEVDAAWLDYYGPEGTLRSVPFWKVVRHRIPADYFRGKIVVVGLTSRAYDRHEVWGVRHHSDMSGAEIEATAIDTLRRGTPLRSPPWELGLVLIAAFALLPLLVRSRTGLGVTLALTLGTAVGYLAAALLAFEHGTVLPVVAPVAALLLAAFALLLVDVAAPDRTPRPRTG